ncbi:MAG TPA: translation initiation factor IF-2 [Patescibacteria group bacterium]
MAQQLRPPVITIMGHVDHGKTTLLDYIRKAKVAAREAGGITQHIGAYQVEHQGKKLTFIDTPGHAAFNKMRERGADVTDLIVLVVAANDGVKPQTIESIRHIKRSNKPFLVAINKIDMEGVYPDMVKAQLAEHDILVQGYGGDVETIELSAKTGKNVDKLLETLAVMAELAEFKADPEAPLEAIVIEATLDNKRGPVASVIVKNGTLKVRQDLTVEDIEGRVRQLTDENSNQLQAVLPGSPAEIVGLKKVPPVGSMVKEVGRDYAEKVENEAAGSELVDADQSPAAPVDPFADLDVDFAFGDKEKLTLIIKADVEGTLEVIKQNLDPDSVEILASGVGQVTEQDIELAQASDARIIAFHIKVPTKIRDLAKQNGVKIKEYDVIYKLIEDLQKQILRLMEPTIDEVVIGEAEILQIFEMKGERIAGVRVKTGEIKRSDLMHLKRGDEILANPVIKSMMHGKEEIQSLKAKNEGGLTFKNKKLNFQVGDILQAYKESDE